MKDGARDIEIAKELDEILNRNWESPVDEQQAEAQEKKAKDSVSNYKERLKLLDFFVRVKTKEDLCGMKDQLGENVFRSFMSRKGGAKKLSEDVQYDKTNFYELKISNRIRIIDRILDQIYKNVDQSDLESFARAVD